MLEMVQKLLADGIELQDHAHRVGARAEWYENVGRFVRAMLLSASLPPELYPTATTLRHFFGIPRPATAPPPRPSDEEFRLVVSCLERVETALYSSSKPQGTYKPSLFTLSQAEASSDGFVVAPGSDLSSQENATSRDTGVVLVGESSGQHQSLGQSELASLRAEGRANAFDLYLDLAAGIVSRAGWPAGKCEKVGATECRLILQVVVTLDGVAAGEFDTGTALTDLRGRFTRARRKIEPEGKDTGYKIFPREGDRYVFRPPDGDVVILARSGEIDHIEKIGTEG